MEVFVASQPIFDKNNKVYGCELLYRDGKKNSYESPDGDKATIDVIRNSIINIGIDRLTSGKKALINFTENILMSDIFIMLPSDKVIIEILETVEPTEEVIERCKQLKQLGFVLALDDFVFDEKYSSLIEIADIIKVDFRITMGYERKAIMNKVKSDKVKFLAEKVETIEEYNQAVQYGYTYFQGYYFSKPKIVSSKKIPENKLIYMDLLNEINNRDFRIENIELLIKKDVSLSYKLLRLINSANFSIKSKIKSLKQAMVLLGEQETKKWLYLIAIQTIANDKPDIILKNSLIRAKFSEFVALGIGMNDMAYSAYLTGMLSMIDTLLDRPLNEILSELMLPDEVVEALNGVKTNKLYLILSLVVCYEKGMWDKVSEYCKDLGLNEYYLPGAYLQSLEWASNE